MVSAPVLGPKDDLHQRLAQALGVQAPEALVEAEGQERRYALLIGGQRLLLDPGVSIRVLVPPTSYRVPNTQPWYLGIVNLRGSLAPLYDIAACLGLAVDPAAQRMMLVLGEGDDAAATLVDHPPSQVLVQRDEEDAEMPLLPDPLAGHACAAHDLGTGVWVEIDWHGLFAELKDLAVR